jgi:hypothetical protein
LPEPDLAAIIDKDMRDYFNRKDGSKISFDNGFLSTSVYSYEIDSVGDLELGAQETRELYEAMKKYYEQQDLKDFNFYDAAAKYVGDPKNPWPFSGGSE